jgi:hypothetical protein
MPKLIIVVVILIGGIIWYGNSQREQSKILSDKTQAYILEQENQKKIITEKEVAAKGKNLLDLKIKLLQADYTMDYEDAKNIIQSDKMTKDEEKYYIDFASKWSDAINLASATGRIALAGPVKNLQDLKREFELHKPRTYCESEMYNSLSNSYNYTVDGFIDFMRSSEYSSAVSASLASDYMRKAKAILRYCVETEI